MLSHHHCAFTNKKKSDPRRMFVGPTGIRSCYPRASTVLHARALSCWPRVTVPGSWTHLIQPVFSALRYKRQRRFSSGPFLFPSRPGHSVRYCCLGSLAGVCKLIVGIYFVCSVTSALTRAAFSVPAPRRNQGGPIRKQSGRWYSPRLSPAVVTGAPYCFLVEPAGVEPASGPRSR